MAFDDRATDGQTHTHSFRFCCVEAFEKLRQVFRLQAEPGVRYRNEDKRLIPQDVRLRLDEELSSVFWNFVHRHAVFYYQVQ